MLVTGAIAAAVAGALAAFSLYRYTVKRKNSKASKQSALENDDPSTKVLAHIKILRWHRIICLLQPQHLDGIRALNHQQKPKN